MHMWLEFALGLAAVKSFLALLALTVALGGCSPCSDSCTQQAAVYDLCLADWNLEWSDLGATDEEDFRYSCSDSNQVWIQSLDSESASLQEQRCSELGASLRGETDCAQAWEALVSYGAEP